MAGFTATVMGTPADVVKTRIMNQPTKDGKGLYYKNSIDCLRKTVSNEGFLALYKGFLPIWMRLGPWSLTFWVLVLLRNQSYFTKYKRLKTNLFLSTGIVRMVS